MFARKIHGVKNLLTVCFLPTACVHCYSTQQGKLLYWWSNLDQVSWQCDSWVRLLHLSITHKLWPSKANQCFCSSLLSIILADLSGNRTFSSTSLNFYGFRFGTGGFWSILCFCVSESIAWDSKMINSRKNTIFVSWLLNFRVRVLLKSIVIYKLLSK